MQLGRLFPSLFVLNNVEPQSAVDGDLCMKYAPNGTAGR